MLNNNGKIAEQQWQWLIDQYSFVISHAFVVMPNHIHLIIEIKSDQSYGVGTGRNLSLHRDMYLQCQFMSRQKNVSCD